MPSEVRITGKMGEGVATDRFDAAQVACMVPRDRRSRHLLDGRPLDTRMNYHPTCDETPCDAAAEWSRTTYTRQGRFGSHYYCRPHAAQIPDFTERVFEHVWQPLLPPDAHEYAATLLKQLAHMFVVEWTTGIVEHDERVRAAIQVKASSEIDLGKVLAMTDALVYDSFDSRLRTPTSIAAMHMYSEVAEFVRRSID